MGENENITVKQTERHFTESQKKFINSKNKSLLVAAGAGSGKTTVLTEKIIEEIKNGEDIDSILVVTFTEAAAASLKEKLYSEFLKSLSDEPNNKRLIRTLYRIPSAKISTIHSFCFTLIKNNFARLSLSPGLRVADSAEKDIILSDCLENLINDCFENDDGDFRTLCDNFANEKSLSGFTESVKEVYEKYSSIPFWKKTAENELERIREDIEKSKKSGFFSCDTGKSFAEYVKTKLYYIKNAADKLVYDISPMIVTEKNAEYAEALVSYIEKVISVFDNENTSFDSVANEVLSFSIKNIDVKKMAVDDANFYKKERDNIVTAIKKGLFPLFSKSESNVISDYEKEYEIGKLLFDFILKLDKKYTEEKSKKGVLDFADLEKYALSLLGEYTENGVVRTDLCKEISNNYTHIYIDEYQDINPLQDMIFSLVSKENNRFMVGDVKQSIYRFRNASAKIFQNYQKKFEEYDENSSSQNGVIYLSENFRCDKPILDFTNLLFENLYTPETVGSDYGKERLIFGKKKENGENMPPVTVKIFYKEDSEANVEDEEESDEEMLPTETEAEYVAKEICRIVKENNEKRYSYGDIALILRSPSTSGTVFEKAFAKYNIPYNMEKSGNILREPEILLALSILKAVDDPYNDISVVAALRSPVFRFTADDIYKVKSYYSFESDSVYDCVLKCSKDYFRKIHPKKYRFSAKISEILKKEVKKIYYGKRNGVMPDDEIKKKCAEFIEKITYLRLLGSEETGSKLIWNMYSETHIVSLCSASCSTSENGREKRENLYTLYRYAVDFEKTSFKGLSAFLEYIDEIAEKYGDTIGNDEDCGDKVRILSIHKSKGLEFPVCFVSAINKSFNVKDISKTCLVNDSGFVFADLRKEDGIVTYTPLVKKIFAFSEKREMLKEELRCLYVALTRAEEKLYVTGAVKGLPENQHTPGFFESKSLMDMVFPIIYEREEKFFDLTLSPTRSEEEESEAEVKNFVENNVFLPDDVFLTAIENGCLTDVSGRKIPSKAAVSEIRKGIFEESDYVKSVSKSVASKKPNFAGSEKTSSEIGTATHSFMQFCNFENIKLSGVKAEINRLCEIGMITYDDASIIDIKAIEKFFESDLYSRMSESKNSFRERRFNLIEDSSLVSGFSGEKVMIQGVIDCFFENPDGTYTVVDYKTDRIKKGEENVLIERHKVQINFYARAVEKITGKRVSEMILYSFSQNKSVYVPELKEMFQRK